jgi:hypoxanthine phosphoribosyltransferase
MIEDLDKILVTEEQIRRRVEVLGSEITEMYRNEEELTVIAVINGAVLFTADLIRHIHIPLRLDSMRVATYKEVSNSQRQPQIIDMLRLDIRDRHVLVIDDVLDTGLTFAKVTKELRKLHPASLRVGVLLEKKCRRELPVEPDFVGFEIPDAFAVGYGLDFAERYRNLPCIGVLKAELQNPPEWQ